MIDKTYALISLLGMKNKHLNVIQNEPCSSSPLPFTVPCTEFVPLCEFWAMLQVRLSGRKGSFCK
jgi:hypothetical protein